MKGRLVYDGSPANNTSFISIIICNNQNLESYRFTPKVAYTDMTAIILSRYSAYTLNTSIRNDRTVYSAKLTLLSTNASTTQNDLYINIADDQKYFLLSTANGWNSAIIFGRGLDGYTITKEISQ